MYGLLLLAVLNSPISLGELKCRTKLIGWSENEELSKIDRWSLEQARKECPKRNPKKPCVVEFVKKGEIDYHAVCGYPRPTEI